MKHFIFILITFSLQAFAHEVENHPEHLKNTCSVSDVGRYQASEEELLHYLNQDCNFSIKDDVYSLNTRIQMVLRVTSWGLHIPVLKKLIELDVDLNTIFFAYGDEDTKSSMLHFAIKNSHSENNYPFTKEQYQKEFEFIELLLKNGADPNWQDILGYTALIAASLASNNKNKPLFNLLIKYGADLDTITSRRGYTAKEYLSLKPPEKYDLTWGPLRGELIIGSYISHDN